MVTNKRPDLLEHLNKDNINPTRDEFEWRVIEKSFALKKPVLGICRGLQLMNIYLGGSLIHDIPTVKNHYGHGSKENIDSRHSIHVQESSLLYSITKNISGEINSAHHQAVEKYSDELTITAESEPGIVETLEDMGTQGIPPTHKSLLDYLAWKFMYEYNWDLKKLMREIVLSACYQQDTKLKSTGAEKYLCKQPAWCWRRI